VDPDNPVVRLCTEGMAAEAQGRHDAAKDRFEQAWQIAADDYERCVAAHYLARQQDGPEQTLRWNEECLRYAELVGDERVAGFLPSLYLNIGHSQRCSVTSGAPKRATGWRSGISRRCPKAHTGTWSKTASREA
jgi:hypothetical protein